MTSRVSSSAKPGFQLDTYLDPPASVTVATLLERGGVDLSRVPVSGRFHTQDVEMALVPGTHGQVGVAADAQRVKVFVRAKADYALIPQGTGIGRVATVATVTARNHDDRWAQRDFIGPQDPRSGCAFLLQLGNLVAYHQVNTLGVPDATRSPVELLVFWDGKADAWQVARHDTLGGFRGYAHAPLCAFLHLHRGQSAIGAADACEVCHGECAEPYLPSAHLEPCTPRPSHAIMQGFTSVGGYNNDYTERLCRPCYDRVKASVEVSTADSARRGFPNHGWVDVWPLEAGVAPVNH